MGSACGSQPVHAQNGPQHPSATSHIRNRHPVHNSIKIHSVVSSELDFDHDTAMHIPLGEVTDEQLLAEVARRRLDLHDNITDQLVKETYDIGKVLGHGASGQVCLATHKKTGKKYACKVVKKNSSMNDAQSMSTEIEIMKRIRHRNIVSMYELYETPRCLWIILELVDGGDLHHFTMNCTHYTEVLAARNMQQALRGIHYLHSLGIVHRDLKLDNLLLTSSGSALSDLKIADFGLSALVRLNEEGYDAEESGKRKNYNHLHDMWGTKEYFAPEVVNQAYGPQADVWALGCVLFELLSGNQAFPIMRGDTESSFYGRIQKGTINITSGVWEKISPDAKDLLKKMLEVDPGKRLSASECLLHRWITGTCHTDLMRDTNLTEVGASLKKRAEEKRQKKH